MSKGYVLLFGILGCLGTTEARCSEYKGCYKDDPGAHDLTEPVPLPMDSLTVHTCVTECISKGFAYAGLQNASSNCWCGNSFGSHGTSSKCDMACPGAPSELCGGFDGAAGPNSVYAAPGNVDDLCGTGTCQADGTCECGKGRSGVLCEVEGLCRWSPGVDGDSLLRDSAVQDAYVQDMLKWDGRFASDGHGITSLSLTCDHVNLDPEGYPIRKTPCGAAYTAASKESLHIEMLALVVNRTRLAWHWIEGAADESSAVAVAVERLAEIISAYEAFDAQYPGLGGFLPWIDVSSDGFKLRNPLDVELPALDNGQLAWGMIAAIIALEAAGEATLAARYEAHVSTMARSVNTLFLRPSDGKAGTTATVADASAPMSASNTVVTGTSVWPFEGELMIFFMDLYGDWSDPSEKVKMWNSVRYHTRQTDDYDNASLPGGPITVQRGWRFSAHEMWKYMVLPYFDYPMALKVFTNGERARTWNSHLKGIPGLLASSYDADLRYRDVFGIPSISRAYAVPPDSELMITPYGAYPLILADRGYGLAWHRAMVSRPLMQSLLGSVEASEAFRSPPRIVHKVSWDTKVTTDLAALGGVSHLLRAALHSGGLYARFMEVVAFNYGGWNSITVKGEANGFAPPPGPDASDRVLGAPADLASCASPAAASPTPAPGPRPGPAPGPETESGAVRALPAIVLVAWLLAGSGASLW